MILRPSNVQSSLFPVNYGNSTYCSQKDMYEIQAWTKIVAHISVSYATQAFSSLLCELTHFKLNNNNKC